MKRAPRCTLFVPAHVDKMLGKALGVEVDAVVLDLEDAVPVDRKASAREGARRYIVSRPGHAFVRINPLDATTRFSTGCGAEDIQGVVRPGLRGIVLPKVQAATDVAACDALMAQAEIAHGIAPGSIELYAIIETARGVIGATAIAHSTPGRPFRLCFGAGDFTTDIGVDWTRDEEESRVARSLIVLSSRSAGLGQPIDSVFNDISDVPGLRENAAMGRRLGFCGKFVIHPSQIGPVTQAFSPSDAEAEWARDVISKLANAEHTGAGAFVVSGKMIDYPIVEKARRLLALWEDMQTQAGPGGQARE